MRWYACAVPGAGCLPQRLLGVAAARALRARANEELTGHMGQSHQASRGTDGALRVQAELAARGVPCGHTRVARLMRRAGLVGCHRRRPVPTTRRAPAAKPAPDLVQRAFSAPAPEQLWSADMTDVPTEEDGLLALAVSLDGCSRRVVGWSMQEHLRTELVLAALQRAIWNRHPREGLIHHADHGCPYTSLLFGERCQAAGIQCSMGSIGDGYDNAMVDRFLATLACELLAQQPFRTHDDARAAVFEWLEIYSHRQRRHSALGFLSPDAYERGWSNHTPVVA